MNKNYDPNHFNQDFEKLRTSESPIVITDGIMDIEKYTNASTKILWILKEPNNEGETSDWDFRGAIKHNLRKEYGIAKGWGKTFNPIVYTTYGILNEKYFEDIPTTSADPSIIDTLHNIAYINIRKAPGSSSSKHKTLQEYYNNNKELILNQINVFNPDVVICGGTFKFMVQDILNEDSISKRDMELINTHINVNRLFVEAPHPMAMVKKKDYCNSIINAVLNWKRNM